MTTKLSSGRARFRRSTAALGIAGLALAGLAGPALADNESSPDAKADTAATTDDTDSEPREERPEDDSSPAVDDVGLIDRSEGENPESSGNDGQEGSSQTRDLSDNSEEGETDTGGAGVELGFGPLSLSPDGGTLTVDLVGVNDFHGRIDATERGGSPEWGAVRLAAAVEDARASEEDTLFVAAGDLFGASTFTSMAADDIPTTDVFNAMELDVSSVGNHEFDQGFQTLQERISGTGDYAGHGLNWPYLGANVYDKGTENAALREYVVETTPNGARIAFIGLVTEETPSLVTPAGIASLDFGDPTEAVERVIETKTEVQEADAIVILTHDGGANLGAVGNVGTHFGAFAKAMADRGDIAAIFSGHTHVEYQALIGDMPVIQTGEYGANLGKITLTFDRDADDGNALTLTGAESGMTPLGSYPVPADGANAVVDGVRALVSAAVEEADAIGSEIIGEAGADFNRAVHKDPDSGNEAENRGGESTISNFIADAQIWAVEDLGATDNLPVIAFMNPGGVRTDIAEGDVTYMQVANVQPFANTLETLDLTGAQVKQVLEEQWQPDGSSRPFLKLGINSELFYTYDPEASRGERITHIFLDDEPLDMTATYRVVVNNFLASGGDNFFTLGEGANYSDTGLVDLQAFVNYFKSQEVAYPDFGQRAVGVHWVTGEDTVYTEGEEFEIDLSSLLFSTNEPKASKFTVLLASMTSEDFVELGEIDVDPTIVDTTDEVGRATAKFAIPEIAGLGEETETWGLFFLDDLEIFGFSLEIDIKAAADVATPQPGENGDNDDDGKVPAPDMGDRTPDTGLDVNGMLIASALLLAIGGTALAVRRRQHTS